MGGGGWLVKWVVVQKGWLDGWFAGSLGGLLVGLKEQDKYEHVSGAERRSCAASLSVAAKWQNSNKHKRAHTYTQALRH